MSSINFNSPPPSGSTQRTNWNTQAIQLLERRIQALIEGGGGGGTNIYNSDGTLTGNRVLTADPYTLNFNKVVDTDITASFNLGSFITIPGGGIEPFLGSFTTLINSNTGDLAFVGCGSVPALGSATELGVFGHSDGEGDIAAIVADNNTDTPTLGFYAFQAGFQTSGLKGTMTPNLFQFQVGANAYGIYCDYTGKAIDFGDTVGNVNGSGIHINDNSQLTEIGNVFGGAGGGTKVSVDDNRLTTTSTNAQAYPTMLVANPSDGDTVILADGIRGAYIDPATTIATLTIQMLPDPTDGLEVVILFGGTVNTGDVITTLTVTPNTGQTLVIGTTISATPIIAGQKLYCKYREGTAQWYISTAK